MHIPTDPEWYNMASEFVSGNEHFSRSGMFDIFKLYCISPDEQHHIGNYMHKIEELKLDICIIDLDSLNFFLQQRNIDIEGIDTHNGRLYSNNDEYENFKEIFPLCDKIEKINEYLKPEIEIYNKLINFEYPNVIKVYHNNKEILCPT